MIYGITCVINLVDPNIVEISSLCTSITFFRLSDLKEILEVLNKSNLEALRLQHIRPLKCKLFLQVTGYNTITTRFCSTGFACVNSKYAFDIWIFCQQKESVRMVTSQPHTLSREEVQSLADEWQQNLLPGTNTCFHGRALSKTLCDLNTFDLELDF